MTPTSIPSPQVVTKLWRCHGTLSSAGCVPPLSGNSIHRQERLPRLSHPTWPTRMAGEARGLPFCKTNGHHCLPLVRHEVVPPLGLDDVQPQHVPREGQVLEPVPRCVPDGVVDGVPICKAEVGPLHGVLPQASCGLSLVVVLPVGLLLPSLLIVELVSLPLMRRHLCHRCTGIFAIFAVAAVALWPLWHLCRLRRHHGGVVALVTMALSLSLVRRYLAIVELALSPLSLVIELESLSLMGRHLCCRCNCNCRPHHDGVVTIVDVQASLLLLSWCIVPLVTVASSPLILICDGIVAVLNLAW